MKKKAILIRLVSEPKQTLGTLALLDEQGNTILTCATLELPWLKNEKKKSCIPTGIYQITPRTSPKYGLHFSVNNVPNRDTILIHPGNYHTQILGCILVGTSPSDLNKDGLRDVTSSRVTLNKILKAAPEGFQLEILNS